MISQKIIDVLNKSEESRAIMRSFNRVLEENNEQNPEVIRKMREKAVMIALYRNEEAKEIFSRSIYNDIRNKG